MAIPGVLTVDEAERLARITGGHVVPFNQHPCITCAVQVEVSRILTAHAPAVEADLRAAFYAGRAMTLRGSYTQPEFEDFAALRAGVVTEPVTPLAEVQAIRFGESAPVTEPDHAFKRREDGSGEGMSPAGDYCADCGKRRDRHIAPVATEGE